MKYIINTSNYDSKSIYIDTSTKQFTICNFFVDERYDYSEVKKFKDTFYIKSLNNNAYIPSLLLENKEEFGQLIEELKKEGYKEIEKVLLEKEVDDIEL